MLLTQAWYVLCMITFAFNWLHYLWISKTICIPKNDMLASCIHSTDSLILWSDIGCGTCELWVRWSIKKFMILLDDAAHSDSRPYICSLCGKRSNWKWDVKKHILSVHRGTIGSILDEQLSKVRIIMYCIYPNCWHVKYGTPRIIIGDIQ